MKYTLEVCADSVRSALEAQEGGADRIELCSNLIIGGTSPGKALFQQVKQYTDLEIRVLLRPRFGDFCYNSYEFAQMKEEAQMYRELGADAIVTGIVCPDGTLNIEQMQELMDMAKGTAFTLHRAFDMCRDPFEALEQAVSLGMRTILTSGQRNSAWEGRDLLRALAEKGAGRIEILAGSRSRDYIRHTCKADFLYESECLPHVRQDRERQHYVIQKRGRKYGTAGF